MTLVADPEQRTDVADVDLVRRIAAGERDALTTLYQRHAPWLTVRLSRRCHQPDLVDTAVQDTFLAVWKQAGRYRRTGEVGAWIWTIGVRRLIDQLRKRPPPEPVSDIDRLAAVVDEEIPLALGHTALGRAFAALPPELRTVLAATALDGLTNREAGTLMGIPTGTVKSRLSRARRQVQETMSRETGTQGVNP